MDRDNERKDGEFPAGFEGLEDLSFDNGSQQAPEDGQELFDDSFASEDLGLGDEPGLEDPWLQQLMDQPEEPDQSEEPEDDRGPVPPREPQQPPKAGMDPKKKRTIILVSILSAVVLVILLLVGGVSWYWNSMLNNITRPEFTENSLSDEEIQYWATYNPDAETATTVPTETTLPMPSLEGDYITNILVIGQDSRKGEDSKLADSIILCSFNRKNATLTLTSFLRDTYIQMPNFKGHVCGKNRINVVYNLGWKWAGELGGMEMMDLCLKQNFGIEVDHNVEINFETFSQVINHLGGVDVELDEAEVNYLKKDKTGFNNYVRPGMNRLDGYTALCYARARKLDGDIQRTNRQRKVVSAIIEKVRDKNLKEIMDLAKEILPLVLTDMSNEEITALVKDVLPLLPKLKINAGMCPAEGTYWGQMIDIGGYPASVIGIYLKPNQQLLQWICEVPAFEASPDAPPTYETLPPPTKKPTEPETLPPELLPDPDETESAPTDPGTVPPPSTEPVVPPSSDPVTPPSTDPVTPPSSDPVTPPSSDPATPPSSDPVTPPSSDPVTPPSSDPVATPSSDPAAPPSSDPAAPPSSDQG